MKGGGGKALLPALAVLAVLVFASIGIAASDCSDAAEVSDEGSFKAILDEGNYISITLTDNIACEHALAIKEDTTIDGGGCTFTGKFEPNYGVHSYIRVTIKNMVFDGNNAFDYAVESFDETSARCDLRLALEDCTFRNYTGGALLLSNSQRLTLKDCTFEGCAVDMRLADTQNASVSMTGCTFSGDFDDFAARFAQGGAAERTDGALASDVSDSTIGGLFAAGNVFNCTCEAPDIVLGSGSTYSLAFDAAVESPAEGEEGAEVPNTTVLYSVAAADDVQETFEIELKPGERFAAGGASLTGADGKLTGRIMADILCEPPEDLPGWASVGTANVIHESASTPYHSLWQAIESAADGDTVQLASDCWLTPVFIEGKKITLDLNGSTAAGALYSDFYSYSALISIDSDAGLTIKDSGTDGGIVCESKRLISSYYTPRVIENYGSFAMESGAIADAPDAGRYLCLFENYGSEFVIANGTFSVSRGEILYSESSNAVIRDGDFASGYDEPMLSGYDELMLSGRGTVEGGKFVNNTDAAPGIFDGTGFEASGGAFSEDVSDSCAEGYIAKLDDGTSLYNVVKIESPEDAPVLLTYTDGGEEHTRLFAGVQVALDAAWDLRSGDNAVWGTAAVTVNKSIASVSDVNAWKVPKLAIDASAGLACDDMYISDDWYESYCTVENAGAISADRIYGELDEGGIANSGTIECGYFYPSGDGWSNSGTIAAGDLRLDGFDNTETGKIEGTCDDASMTVVGEPVTISGKEYIGTYSWNSDDKAWEASGRIEVIKDGETLTAYDSMQDAYAYAAANEADTLRLAASLYSNVTVDVSTAIAVDLNGCTITDTSFAVGPGGSLTITDSKAHDDDGAYVSGTAKSDRWPGAVWVKGGGSFTMESGRLVSYFRYPAVLVADEDEDGYIAGASGAEVFVRGGVIENTCSYGYSDYYAPFNVPSAILILGTGGDSTASDPALTVAGGEVKCDHGIAIMGSRDRGNTSIAISGGKVSSIDMPAVYHPQLGKLIMTGGEVSGRTGIAVKGGDVSISGGAVAGTGESAQPAPSETWTSNPGCAVYLETGFGHHAAVAISGGSFSAVGDAPAALLCGADEDAVLAIAGGTFTSDPAAYVDKTKNNIVFTEELYEVNEGATQYKVTFDPAGGSSVEAASVDHGSKATEPAVEKEGYTFTGWMLGETKYDFDAPVTEDLDLVASWSINQYTVTFTDAGRDDVVKSLDYGAPLTAPAWSKDGYGLSWDPGLDGTVPAGNVAYKAVWTAKEYKVIFHSAGDYYSRTFTFDAPAELPSPADRPGYAFGGWAASESGPAKYSDGQEDCFRPYAKRVDIYAVWAPNTYAVAVAPAEHGSVSAAESAACGSTVAVTLSPAEGYRLASISAEPAVAFSGDGDVCIFTMPASDVAITAVFAKSLCTVTWKGWDGTILETEEGVPYGTPVAWKGASAPVREPTAEFDYAFAGWEPALVDGMTVAGDMVFLAQFDSAKRSYGITFVVDGVETVQTLEYGATPVYDGTPAKDADAQYTYAFEKWDPEIAAVSGPATYTAAFKQTVNSYNVTWRDWDGAVIETDEVPYGAVPTFDGAVPARESTAEFSYVFDKWTPEVAAVAGDAEYTAAYTETARTYTVTWKDGDVILDAEKDVPYGTAVAWKGTSVPAREPTAEFEHAFAGWSPAVDESTVVVGDMVFLAQFESVKRSYDIVFIVDGVETMQTLEYGATPAYGGVPAKEADAQYTYAFERWDPEIAAVSGPATYAAVFSETLRTYTVTVAAGEHGTVDAASVEAEYGAAISVDGCRLTVGGTVFTAAPDEAYVFASWTPIVEEGATVAGDVTYTAAFAEAGRTYAVVWKNWNGDVLLEDAVDAGAAPVYAGDAPEREADAQYTYAFERWDPEVVAATGPATYTAVFSETLRTYTVTVAAGEHGAVDGASVEAPYSTAVSADGCRLTVGDNVFTAAPDEAYVFASWTPAVEDGATVAGDVTYTAVFAEAGRTYAVVWKNWNGDILLEGAVDAGAAPVYAGEAPVKEADAQFTYAFSGWSPEVVPAVGDAEYTAQFDGTVRTYTVTVAAGDHGSVDIASVEAEYGAAVSADGCRLTIGGTVVTATPDEAYAFEKWTPAAAAVAGDVTYTAVFAAEAEPEPEPEPEDEGGDGGSTLLYVGIAVAAIAVIGAAGAFLFLRGRR